MPKTVIFKNIRRVGSAVPEDIVVDNGVLAAIGPNIVAPADAAVYAWDNATVSPGWFDIGVQACDPGYEHREDLHTAMQAAAAGGFTGMAVFPNTQPVVHSKSEVVYLRNKTAGHLVDVQVIGAVSVDAAGKDLAELYDMHTAGIIAFSDGDHPVQDAGLMLRALQYVQAFNGLVINQPYHKTLAGGGQMHEGVVSTSLGLKGLPALSEEVALQRDLSLLEYSGGRLHCHLISTKKSVSLIRAAKAAGLQVTCSVALANLCSTDERLSAFDSNWKVNPPLRGQSDVDALLEGLLDGTIDCISTHHTPWDEESKNLEYPYAAFGMTGLDTAFIWYATFLSERLPLSVFIEKITEAPRRILGLPAPQIAVGQPANLTFFATEPTYNLTASDLHSKSYNTPLLGTTVRGKVLGTMRGDCLYSRSVKITK
jgi:dihydroorotase